MTRITIKDPVNWWHQCDWIRIHCRDWVDETYWAAWNIGYEDIYFSLRDEDAVLFHLRWS